ncbi:energy-coupling factor ABC transporter ATP-binding protein [Desulfotomaculum copahuensis]|uniref:ABC transporter ATP-binding protein n=1 Tax=Desulfotomaculum copahuensis TaxID=1838280 RepID=A0A1B7LBV6_9FIRM|nr:ATP-binding cassette domain-containing protein [Desulfotomaculum copahuensis]OAT79953.1 energy-coupling factor ABC transporter ATP-binding protein [Desulfotomaculum copahuensis]
MPEFILEADTVEFSYPDGTRALQGVFMRIPRGAKVAVLGSNGAGKTTLFLHFNGILRPAGGRVRFDGREVRYDHRSLMQLRKNVGIVFQDPDSQLFSASVFQEISFGPLNLGLPREEVRRRVEEAMQATEITGLKDKPTHLLSYGQKKRVSIADILAMEPAVIICDEPTAWLDPKHAEQVMELFKRINNGGTTVILSTHDVDMAYSWADYIFIMMHGTVIGEGTPEEVFQDGELLFRADLARPRLVETWAQLRNKGLLPADLPLPRSWTELFELVPTRRAPGTGGPAPVYVLDREGTPACAACSARRR